MVPRLMIYTLAVLYGWTGVVSGQVIDLSQWKLTLPIDQDQNRSPDEILYPELSRFRDARYFDLDSAMQAFVFRAECGGVPTRGSKYPRSELREMTSGGMEPAAWGTDDGQRHVLQARLAIHHLPEKKPHVICLQIHNESEKLLALRLEGKKLKVEGEGQSDVTVLRDYELGTWMSVRVEVSSRRIRLHHDDRMIVDWEKEARGCYFKAGCYTQSNPGSGDESSAYAEIRIRELSVTHSP